MKGNPQSSEQKKGLLHRASQMLLQWLLGEKLKKMLERLQADTPQLAEQEKSHQPE